MIVSEENPQAGWIRSAGDYLALLLAFGVLGGCSVYAVSYGIGVIDTLEYWAAGRLFIEGKNPYDYAQIHELQRTVFPDRKHAVQLWNPPLFLFLVGPLAMLPFSIFAPMWFVLSVAVTAVCIVRAALFAGVGRGVVLLISATSSAIFTNLYYGQTSAYLLCGLILFLEGYSERRAMKAAVGLVLTTWKPHLLFLLYAEILLRARSSWPVLLRAAALFVLLLGATFALRPDALHQYLAAIQRPPIDFMTPTVGCWLQWAWGMHTVPVRLFPSLIAIFALLAFRPRRNLGGLLLIIPWSLAFSPYGWVYDQMLLLPVLFALIAGNRPLLWVVLAMNLGLLLAPWEGQEYYLWYPLITGVLVFLNPVEDELGKNPAKNPATPA